jgi:hypothetical protein
MIEKSVEAQIDMSFKTDWTKNSARMAKARKRTGKYFCVLAHYIPIASTHVDN